jgi:predicted N-formylglutamate amidohydrolase
MLTPFTLIPFAPGRQSPLLFLCDHASNAVPAPYGDLGLPAELFQTHIAYDIGAAEVATALAKMYGAAAVLGGVSRLLIDLNRGPEDPTLVMKLSDGRIIPGNRGVDEKEVARRLGQFHTPYHRAIRKEIARIESLPRARNSALAAGRGSQPSEPSAAADSRGCEGGPILISIHSFTPSWKTVARPWEVGVLYGRDQRLAVPLMKHLAAAGFTVGDNEPYTGALEGDTLDTHGTRTGHANVLMEIRQDFLGNAENAGAFAERLKPVLDNALAEMERLHGR